MFSKNVLSLSLILAAAVHGQNVLLKQNWDDSTRHNFWYTDQGSRILPLDLFKDLECATECKYFWERLDRYGFIIDDFKLNTDVQLRAFKERLPIGFSVSEDDKNWVGVTCSACHTGLIVAGKQRFMIEGAPAMIYFDQFVSDMVDAMEATWAPGVKHDRFFKAHPGVETEFEKLLIRHRIRKQINIPKIPAGFGRLDAFGHIFNQVIVEHLKNDPELAFPSYSPASFPVLWDIGQHKNGIK